MMSKHTDDNDPAGSCHNQSFSRSSSTCSSTSSAPIPFPQSHLRRTTSEVNIEEGNKLAEWRDDRMYHRLLTGMFRRSQEKGLDRNPKIIRSMENLMKTHASTITSLEASSKRNEEWDIIKCEPSELKEMNQMKRSCSSSGSLHHSSSITSLNSAISGFSSSSLSRRPSRRSLSLAPLKESLKSSFTQDGILFELEM